MNLLRLSLLFFSLYSFSGQIKFIESFDEFTDERTVTLGLLGDENNSFNNEMIAVVCETEKIATLGISKGIIFNLNNNLLVTMRFDKKEPIKKNFTFNSSAQVLYTRDTNFIKLFLKELKDANNLILKIQGETGVMRFTDLTSFELEVDKFEKASSKMQSCNLF